MPTPAIARFAGFCWVNAPFVPHRSSALHRTHGDRRAKATRNPYSRFGIACSIFLLSSMTDGTAADSVPKFNMNPTCEAAASGAVSAGRDKEACRGDERTAQDQVTKNWSQYSARDKTDCVGMERKGGPPSYVELLSCLEIMKDSKKVHEELAQPLLGKKGAMDSQSIPLTDFDEGGPGTHDRAKAHRGYKRKHQQARSMN